jgi:hypothetical protein
MKTEDPKDEGYYEELYWIIIGKKYKDRTLLIWYVKRRDKNYQSLCRKM